MNNDITLTALSTLFKQWCEQDIQGRYYHHICLWDKGNVVICVGDGELHWDGEFVCRWDHWDGMVEWLRNEVNNSENTETIAT